jgi:leucyl aminopeptidase (aminopeptidase T)
MDALNSLRTKVAKKVLQKTLSVKKGETVTVESWNNGLEFARILLAEARAMGTTAVLVLEDEGAYIEGVKRSPKNTLGKMGGNEYGMLKGTDAYVFIPGPLLAAYQTKINPRLMSDSTRYNSSWYDAAKKAKLKGARLTFGYIGEEMARIMGRTVQQVAERQLSAALVNFEGISSRARRLSSGLTDGSKVSVRAGGARLEFILKGETTIEDGVVSPQDMRAGNNMTYVRPDSCRKGSNPHQLQGR